MGEWDEALDAAWAILRNRKALSDHPTAVGWASGYVDAQRAPSLLGVPPGIHPGDRVVLSADDLARAERDGTAQHKASGARGTRGGGADRDKRIKGVTGEIGVARLLGIPPQVRVMHGPEAAGSCDLIYEDLCIEVKAGLPLVHVDAHRPGVLYVCVEVKGATVTVKHAAFGRTFARRRPPAWATPRPGTNALNVWFGKIGA